MLQVIGEDFRAFRLLSKTNTDGIPMIAICVQATLSLIMIATSTFDAILVFSGFILALNSFAAVAGVYVLRWREPDRKRPYRAFGYPLTPMIYLALAAWTLVFLAQDRLAEVLAAVAVITAGAVLYLVSRSLEGQRSDG